MAATKGDQTARRITPCREGHTQADSIILQSITRSMQKATDIALLPRTLSPLSPAYKVLALHVIALLHIPRCCTHAMGIWQHPKACSVWREQTADLRSVP